jgi:hypothetical protein
MFLLLEMPTKLETFKSDGTFHPIICHHDTGREGGIELQLLALHVVVQPHATDGLPRERYTVPILQEGEQSEGPVWTGAENLAKSNLPASRNVVINDCGIPAHL